METTIRPKNFKLSPDIQDEIGKRVERVTRYLPNVASVEVLLSQLPTHLNAQRFLYVAQVTLHTRHGNLIRSEVRDPELLTAIDETCAHLSRQISHFKSRYERRKRGGVSLGRTPAMDLDASMLAEGPSVAEMAAPARVETETRNVARTNGQEEDSDQENEGSLGTVVRVKGFSVKPMFPEDAIEQMELLGHSFFVFTNASDESINVLYRRNDGNYGLIQPEFGG